MISSFNVTVFERTVNDKGVITKTVVNPTLSGIVDAPNVAVATFVAQQRAFAGAALGDVDALTALYNKYIFKVEEISPVTRAA